MERRTLFLESPARTQAGVVEDCVPKERESNRKKMSQPQGIEYVVELFKRVTQNSEMTEQKAHQFRYVSRSNVAPELGRRSKSQDKVLPLTLLMLHC